MSGRSAIKLNYVLATRAGYLIGTQDIDYSSTPEPPTNPGAPGLESLLGLTKPSVPLCQMGVNRKCSETAKDRAHETYAVNLPEGKNTD